jgi:LPS sulfotransferase NodH
MTFIYLSRRNKLDQAISSVRAANTDIWHSTHPDFQHQHPDYTFRKIARTLAWHIEQERRLVAQLRDVPGLIMVDYDDLVADPATICRHIAERLGVASAAEPSAQVEKMADAVSAATASRFLREAEERGLAVTPFLDTARLWKEPMADGVRLTGRQ